MKDSFDTIIYVGKSKNLKSRVGSYFQSSKAHSSKVLKLIKNIRDFQYILTDTEFEAFMLECKLIQEIKPIYNRKMKSPLAYTYIKITINEKYPNISLCHEYINNDSNLYFGPYTNKNTIARAIQGIKEFCRIPCNNPSVKNTSCLNYSLGLCIGTCLDSSFRGEYLKIIDRVITLLNGSDNGILKEMENKMLETSEKFDFEAAAKYRDYIGAVYSILNNEKIVEFTEENKNIVLLERLNKSIVKLFLIKRNKVLFSEKYSFAEDNLHSLKQTLLANINRYFYDLAANSSTKLSKEELDEAHIIYSYLRYKNNDCKYIIIEDKWIANKDKQKIDEAIDSILSYFKFTQS
jgi:excinuclease ABC subunit C